MDKWWYGFEMLEKFQLEIMIRVIAPSICLGWLISNTLPHMQNSVLIFIPAFVWLFLFLGARKRLSRYGFFKKTIPQQPRPTRSQRDAIRTRTRTFVCWVSALPLQSQFKCRTISLSQYTFNQFWKHFYLFSSYSHVIFVFLFHLVPVFRLLWIVFPLLFICSRSLLYMLLSSFHFTLCLFAFVLPLRLLCFCLPRCVLLSASPQSVFDLDSSIWWTRALIAYTTHHAIIHINTFGCGTRLCLLLYSHIAVCWFFSLWRYFFQHQRDYYFFCIFAYILRFNNRFAKSFSVMEKRIACVLCEHLHIPWEGGAQLIGREENQ